MTHSAKTDEELGLWVAAHAPNAEAHAPYAELYVRLASVSERFIAARIGQRQADDVRQETWQKAWKNAHEFVGGNYRAWLLTIAARTVIDTMRHEGRRPTVCLAADELDRFDGNLQSLLIDHEEQESFWNCFRQLDERSQQLMRQRFSGKRYDEICEQMAISETAAHKIFFNAKKRLQDCVQRKAS